jgi:prophage regulatory protein
MGEIRMNTILPSTGYLRLAQIIGNPKSNPPIPAIIPISKSSWWLGVKQGKYPPGIKISPRITFWKAEDIIKLINDLSS